MYYSSNMTLAGAPIRLHYSWDKTRIDFVNTKNWGRAEMKDIDFYSVGGKTVFEARSGDGGVAMANIVYIVAQFQVFNENPGEGAYVDTLAIPSGY